MSVLHVQIVKCALYSPDLKQSFMRQVSCLLKLNALPCMLGKIKGMKISACFFFKLSARGAIF